MSTPISLPPAAADPSFRWTDVAPEDRDWLRKRTEDVVGFAYRRACDVVRIGLILLDVKSRLGKGRYQEWVTTQLPFTLRHARRYAMVGKSFGGYASGQFVRFDPSALYVLARPDGVKPEVRAHAVQLADAGEKITYTRALELIEAHKPEPATKAEQKADERALTDRMASIREQEKADRKEAAREETDADRAAQLAKIGGALVELAAKCTVMHVARIEDEDDLPLFSVTTYREDDRPRNAVRRTLLDALLAAGKAEKEKLCPTCHVTKSLSEFGELRSGVEGRNRCCKVCERGRIARVKKRKKAKRAASHQPPPAAAPTPPV